MQFRKKRGFLSPDGPTVRRQFGLATGLVCLALVGLLTAGAALVGRTLTGQIVRDDMAELADTMMDSLQRGMFERFRELQLLARLESHAELLSSDPERTQRILENIKGSFPHYAWIGLAHPDGTVHAATGAVLAGRSVESHGWFRQGLQGPALGDVHHNEEIARHLPATHGRRFVSISVPVHRQDGSLMGIVGAHIDWQWTDTLRREFLRPKHDGAPTEIRVLSGDGLVLLGPNAGQRMYNAEQVASMAGSGSGTMIDREDGRSVLTGFAVDKGYRDYPGLGWITLARRPADVAFRPVDHLVWALAALGLTMVIVAVLLAFAVAHRISTPIRTLTDAAKRIGRDPNTEMFPQLDSPYEVAQLSSVLRQLLCRVGVAEQRTAEVEHRAEAEARRLEANIDGLRKLADTDPLTGLFNRRAFISRAENAVAETRYRIAILMIDIDRFKSINDRHGHPAGDAVIRAVANAIATNVRKTDIVGRFGGEEFIVVLPEIDAEEVFAQGERIRSIVGETAVVYEQTTMRISVSCGGAVMTAEDRDVQALIERADAALYEAKRTGRNRVRIAPQYPAAARDVA